MIEGRRIRRAGFLVLAAALLAGAAVAEEPGGEIREFKILARNWSFSPDTIRVEQGARVVLRIESLDAPHSFVLKPYRLKVPLPQDDTTVVEFVADKPGTFQWRCGRPCGNGCPKMKGELIVAPKAEPAAGNGSDQRDGAGS